MDNNEARVILSAYRPNGADAQDPTFAKALAQAKMDPALGEWLDGQRSVDAALIERLRTIEPPADLPNLVMAGLKTVPLRRDRWFGPLSAMAAVLTVSAVVLIGPLRPSSRSSGLAAAFQRDALAMVSLPAGPKLDLITSSFAETQAYIAQQQGPSAPAIPASLQRMHTAGCRVMEWRGHRMSLTCFRLPDGRLVHLLVIPKSALGTELPPQPGSEGPWEMICQEMNGMVMLWASQTSPENLRQILQS
ncbi:MAG TPA: hypothetical protein VGD78_02235 [Chthoniobacterales bacterium]